MSSKFSKIFIVASFMIPGTPLVIAADTYSPYESSELEADYQDNFDCLIEPHAVIEVSTREEGIVDEVAVSRGDIVKQGQVLVKLDSAAEQLAVKLAREEANRAAKIESKRAALKYLRRQQKRVDDLFSKKAVSSHDKDKADTDVLLAEIELRDERESRRVAQIEKERAEQFLKQRTIFSPVDSVVVKTHLSPGESVENRPIMTLAQVDPLNVEVILPLKMFGQVKVGEVADITPRVPGGETVQAKLVIVDRVIDAASNTFGVRLELSNPDYSLPGGIRCDISFKQ